MDILDLSIGEKKNNKRKGVTPQRKLSDSTAVEEESEMMQQGTPPPVSLPPSMLGNIFNAVQKQQQNGSFVERRSPISVYEGSRLNSDDDSTELSSISSSHKQCDLDRPGELPLKIHGVLLSMLYA